MEVKKHPLFSTLNEEEFDALISNFDKKQLKKETTITSESNDSQKAFILVKGKVAVIKETMYHEDYIVTEIDANGKEFFGELNIVDCGKVTSTIKTLTECTILEVNHTKLKPFLDANPIIGYKVAWYLCNSLARHLRKADDDIHTLFNALVEVVEND